MVPVSVFQSSYPANHHGYHSAYLFHCIIRQHKVHLNYLRCCAVYEKVMHMLGVNGTVKEYQAILVFKWLIIIKYHLPDVDFSEKSIIPQKCFRKSFALAM